MVSLKTRSLPVDGEDVGRGLGVVVDDFGGE